MKKTLTVICAALMLSTPLASFAQPGPPDRHDGGPSHQATRHRVNHSTRADMTMAAVLLTVIQTSAHNKACRYLISSGSGVMPLIHITVETVTG